MHLAFHHGAGVVAFSSREIFRHEFPPVVDYWVMIEDC
jgi:hypothetical protein